MFFLVGDMSVRKGDNEHAIELFKRAQEAIPFQQSPRLVAISLVSYPCDFLFDHTNSI